MSGSKSQQHARAQHNLPYVPRVSMHGTNHGLKTFYEHNHHTADPTLGVRSHGPEQVARNNANIAAQARSLRHSPTDIGLKSPYRPKTWDAIHADIRQSCHTEQQRPEAALILGRSWQDEILNHNQTKIILQMESQRRKAAELIAWDASRARVDCARALAEKTKGYMTHNMCREHLAREENRRTKLEEELAQARAELVRIKARKVLLTESSGKDRQIRVLKQKLDVERTKSSGDVSAASAVESASEDGNMMDIQGS